MAVTVQRPLDYFHLGIKGVIAGDPDGIFSGDLEGVGDGTGGKLSIELHYGNVTTGPDKLDIAMRLNWITVQNPTDGVNASKVNVQYTKTLPFGGGASRQILGFREVLTDAEAGELTSFPDGLWTFPQKDDSLFIKLESVNTDALTMSLVIQGYFWYMGRLRRRLMEDPLD